MREVSRATWRWSHGNSSSRGPQAIDVAKKESTLSMESQPVLYGLV
jgi:hypothetical protein